MSSSGDYELPPCPDGDRCTDMDERHLSAFSHGGFKVRKLCPPKSDYYSPLDSREWTGFCTDPDPKHAFEFCHPHSNVGRVPFQGSNVRDIGNVTDIYEHPEHLECFRVDFLSNTQRLLNITREYVKKENGGEDVDSKILEEIKEWFLNLCPVHICSDGVLLSCIKNGGIQSRISLKSFWFNDEAIANAVWNNLIVRDLFKTFRPGSEKYPFFRKYLLLQVIKLRYETLKENFDEAKKKISENYDDPEKRETHLKDIDELKAKTREITPEEKVERDLILYRLLITPKETADKAEKEDIDKLDEHIKSVLKSVLFLFGNLPGVGNTKDERLRLDYSPFAIVGPNQCIDYGNGDCAVILNPNVMFHPDFYMTPVAAVLYLGRAYRKTDDVTCREWVNPENDPQNKALLKKKYPSGNRKYISEKAKDGDKDPWGCLHDLCLDKLSPAIPEWADAMAYEWIARVHSSRGTPVKDIKLSNILDLWKEFESRYVSEGHLPQSVPRQYWLKIIMKKKSYEYIMADESGKAFIEHFTKKYPSEGIVVVPDDADLSKVDLGMIKPEIDKSSKEGKELIADLARQRAVLDRVFDEFNPENEKRYRRGPYCPTGFTFGLDQKCPGKEVFIPIEIPIKENPVCHLYFTATRGKFSLILGNTGDVFEKDKPRVMLSLKINTKEEVTKKRLEAQLCHDFEESEIEPEDDAFGKQKAFEDRNIKDMHFHLELCRVEREVRVMLSGNLWIRNHAIAVFKIDDKIPFEFSHISFMPGEEGEDINPTIWNLKYTPKPLLEPVIA